MSNNIKYYYAAVNLIEDKSDVIFLGETIKHLKSSTPIEITKQGFIELCQTFFCQFKTPLKKNPDGTESTTCVTYIKFKNPSEPPIDKYRINKITQSFKKEEIEPKSTSKTCDVESCIEKADKITENLSVISENKKIFVPSKYQQEIFNYIDLLVKDPTIKQRNIVIEAVAGSGKTKTIEEATKRIPSNKSSCFLAFNTHIVNEFKIRAPDNIKYNVKTLNGAGFQSFLKALENKGMESFKKDIVEENNVRLILKELLFKYKFREFTIDEIDNLTPPVTKLVPLFKQTGLYDINLTTKHITLNEKDLETLTEKYNIDTENTTNKDLLILCESILNINIMIFEFIKMKQLNKESISWTKIDYDDQLILPVLLSLPTEKYDFVFIDETQDLSMAKIELAIYLCKENGSIIAVGDRYQSIYGFAGADIDAVPNIIKRINAKTFPLSICYRCPKSHIKLAQKFVPHIQYATLQNSTKEAIEGSIISISSDELTSLIKPGDKIICRNSAPLVHPCFELIKIGKKATILGSNIGEGLKTLIIRIKGKNEYLSMKEFLERLDKWKEKEIEKLKKKDKPIGRIEDQYATLKVLSENCESIECILKKIKDIFTDNKEKEIIFSTIHKAKGLEAKEPENSIFIIMSYSFDGKNKTRLMPSIHAKKEWEIQQEKNIEYVAYTRGKDKMYLVDNI